MTQPQVIQGTGEELLPYIERYRDRPNLMLSIPAEEERAAKPEPTEEEIMAVNARLRRHIVLLGYATGLDNESIDADLAKEYGDSHQAPRREDNLN